MCVVSGVGMCLLSALTTEVPEDHDSQVRKNPLEKFLINSRKEERIIHKLFVTGS
jgi:hypothetical protein